MPKYVDDNGQPRFGVRVSPEELERIRREQGIDTRPPAPETSAAHPLQATGTHEAGASEQAAQAHGPSDPGARPPIDTTPRPTGRHAAPDPHAAPSADPADPYVRRAQQRRQADGVDNQPTQPPQQSAVTPPTAPVSVNHNGIAQAPPGGWSWQKGAPVTPPRRAGGEAYTSARPRRRWGLFVVGLLLLIVVPAALAVAGVASAVNGSFGSGTVLTSSGQVYLDADSTVGVYATYSQAHLQECSATSPSGAVTALEPADIAGAQTVSSMPYASLTAHEEGRYTISCPQGSDGLIVGPALNLDRIGLASVFMMGSFLCGIVGLVVTIVGIVRLVRSRRRS